MRQQTPSQAGHNESGRSSLTEVEPIAITSVRIDGAQPVMSA